MDDLTPVPSGSREPRKRFFLLVVALGGAVLFGVILGGRGTALKNSLLATLGTAERSFKDAFGARERWRLAAEVDLGVYESVSSTPPLPSPPAKAESIERKQAAGVSFAGAPSKTQSVPAGEDALAETSTRQEAKEYPATPSSARKFLADAAEVKPSAQRVSTPQSPPKNIAQPRALCAFGSSASVPTRRAIFSEVAWMGSSPRAAESAAAAANNEWIEIKNNSGAPIDFSGWQIVSESGKIAVVFGDASKLQPYALYLLERSDDSSVPGVAADAAYSGALSNAGEQLKLFDDACVLADELDASTGWPGGDNATKQTLERNRADFGWHTSASPGGTPKKENSEPPPVAAPSSTRAFAAAAVSSTASASSSVSLIETPMYVLTVSMQGDGAGEVTSTPAGIYCGFDCIEYYPQGTRVALGAVPSPDSVFDGWSGACSGKGACDFNVSAATSVAAAFKLIAPKATGAASGDGPTASPATSGDAAAGASHLVIAEVQIAGASTTDDFVKIFNPLSAPFNLKGYRLVKRAKTSTGDTSLKSWTADTFIQANGYYLWARSSFVTIPEVPDATTLGSIADDNGVAIRLGPEDTGAIIDSVAWGEAANGFVEGSAHPTNPGANQKLVRKNSGGIFQDTDNNSVDFEIRN